LNLSVEFYNVTLAYAAASSDLFRSSDLPIIAILPDVVSLISTKGTFRCFRIDIAHIVRNILKKLSRSDFYPKITGWIKIRTLL
jgi:hypothetical protein